MNGPATLGDLQGRENSVASSFRPTVAGILGESSWYALRLQTVRPAWRVGQRGGQRAGSHLHCDVVNVGSSTINVKIELVGGNGMVVGSRSGSLRPGAPASNVGQCPTSAGGTPPGCGGYCGFTAPRTHKNQIRGSLIITSGDSPSPLVALPAQ